MRKRGQISIFILLGFTLVVAFFFVLYINSGEDEKKVFDQGPSSLKGYVESCIKQVGENAIYDVSLQGGYYIPPEMSTRFVSLYLPYYWLNGASLLPALEDIENQLALYLMDNINVCLNDFLPYKELGYEIVYKEGFESDAAITPNNVIFSMEYPIELKKGSSSSSFSSFNAKVDVNIRQAYSYAAAVVEEQKKHPNEIPESFINSLAYRNGFTMEMVDYNKDEEVISLLIPQKNKDELIYAFVHKYNWSELR